MGAEPFRLKKMSRPNDEAGARRLFGTTVKQFEESHYYAQDLAERLKPPLLWPIALFKWLGSWMTAP